LRYIANRLKILTHSHKKTMPNTALVPLQIIKHPIIHQAFEDFSDASAWYARYRFEMTDEEFLVRFLEVFYIKHTFNGPTYSADDLRAMLLALFGWSVQKVVLNFHPALYEEFKNKPTVIGFLPPYDLLHKTPFFQPYYLFKEEAYEGFTFAVNPSTLTINLMGLVEGKHLTQQIHFDLLESANTIENQLNTFLVKQNELVSREELKRLVSLALQMILFTCSLEPDLEERIQHKPLIAKNSKYTPRFVREIEVGARIGSRLSMMYSGYRQAERWALQHSQVRPHLRRAHWHLIWKGPVKDGRGRGFQTPELRWYPPTFVKIPDDELIEKTVH